MLKKWMTYLLAIVILTNCKNMTEEKYTNHLINESSPYLLQHSNNPVDWYPWGETALALAKEQNKPILLSIGYSSCHWCHVMAHESFENAEIAAIMNENFVNIKLDREERPDIDNVYLDAVQLMGLRGGWPLNVFLTPDQKPFYGGTYFPTDQWRKLLISVRDAYYNKHDKLYESAAKFTQNLQQSEAEKYGLMYGSEELSLGDFDNAYDKISKKFDRTWGGMDRAPKFPMPVVWNYLATYAQLSGNQAAVDHLLFTLDKMAAGGIYDHVGGGFARYSVDGEWHVPHFEKMLYDNGQLLSLYAKVYKLSHKENYLKVLQETAEWLSSEMITAEGGFYSALDADSEGEEGKFYVWTFDEIQHIAGEDFSIIAEYFDITPNGNWENGKNVLRKLEEDKAFLQDLSLTQEELNEIISKFKSKALTIRDQRPKPGLDSKILSGWNGLALTGICDAYQATGLEIFKNLAQKNASFIQTKLIADNKLIRTYGKNTTGFLEDYAAVIQSFIKYFETFGDESYLSQAQLLIAETITNYFDETEHLFYFSSGEAETLIARKKELFDNVIPASNSIMAENLYKMGLIMDNDNYKNISLKMTSQVNKLLKDETEFLANWSNIALIQYFPTAEIVVLGEEAMSFAQNLNEKFIPGKVILASKTESRLPLFNYKTAVNGKTTIYVCFNKTCQRPVFTVAEALKLIHEGK